MQRSSTSKAAKKNTVALPKGQPQHGPLTAANVSTTTAHQPPYHHYGGGVSSSSSSQSPVAMLVMEAFKKNTLNYPTTAPNALCTTSGGGSKGAIAPTVVYTSSGTSPAMLAGRGGGGGDPATLLSASGSPIDGNGVGPNGGCTHANGSPSFTVMAVGRSSSPSYVERMRATQQRGPQQDPQKPYSLTSLVERTQSEIRQSIAAVSSSPAGGRPQLLPPLITHGDGNESSPPALTSTTNASSSHEGGPAMFHQPPSAALLMEGGQRPSPATRPSQQHQKQKRPAASYSPGGRLQMEIGGGAASADIGSLVGMIKRCDSYDDHTRGLHNNLVSATSSPPTPATTRSNRATVIASRGGVRRGANQRHMMSNHNTSALNDEEDYDDGTEAHTSDGANANTTGCQWIGLSVKLVVSEVDGLLKALEEQTMCIAARYGCSKEHTTSSGEEGYNYNTPPYTLQEKGHTHSSNGSRSALQIAEEYRVHMAAAVAAVSYLRCDGCRGRVASPSTLGGIGSGTPLRRSPASKALPPMPSLLNHSYPTSADRGMMMGDRGGDGGVDEGRPAAAMQRYCCCPHNALAAILSSTLAAVDAHVRHISHESDLLRHTEATNTADRTASEVVIHTLHRKIATLEAVLDGVDDVGVLRKDLAAKEKAMVSLTAAADAFAATRHSYEETIAALEEQVTALIAAKEDDHATLKSKIKRLEAALEDEREAAAKANLPRTRSGLSGMFGFPIAAIGDGGGGPSGLSGSSSPRGGGGGTTAGGTDPPTSARSDVTSSINNTNTNNGAGYQSEIPQLVGENESLRLMCRRMGERLTTLGEDVPTLLAGLVGLAPTSTAAAAAPQQRPLFDFIPIAQTTDGDGDQQLSTAVVAIGSVSAARARRVLRASVMGAAAFASNSSVGGSRRATVVKIAEDAEGGAAKT